MTKAQEVFEKVGMLVAAGKTKAEAFKELAAEYGQPVGSIRGSFYQHARGTNGEGTSSRPCRRATTPEDALADARAAFERALSSIDREVEVAKTRADEAKAEYEHLKASSTERKAAIQQRLETLK